MRFDAPLRFGTLIERHHRFLAEVVLDSGERVTAHCPNTGRMTTCATPGWRVALSEHDNPKRKYRYTWELVHNGSCWIGVHTGRANELAAEAVAAGTIPSLAGYPEILREQSFGRSRFDLLLKRGDARCYVEVKNVTLVASDGCYAFPDAVTVRGRKHLEELATAVTAGHRAAMLFVVARSDGTRLRAAREIDPAYADALAAAQAVGVELHAWRAQIAPEGMRLVAPVTIDG